MSVSKITPCLWFDSEAEEAASFYVSIFKNSKIKHVQRYTEAGREVHGKEPGSALMVEFELNGNSFAALNGGPKFNFTEAVSFQIDCEDQEEVDHFWNKLGDGGDETKQVCGWVADKYGLSWQVVPKQMKEFLAHPDKQKSRRAMEAMMKMKKLDIAELQKAFDG